MLPESKDDFPKLLYLDQNKWIDLSRAHYRHPKGEPFRDALAAVRRAVETGKLIVPLSAVAIVEMANDSDAERRERLLRFMIDLSRNLTILSFMTVRPWEVRNAVHAFYGRPEPVCVRRSIVREGFYHALGMRLRLSGLPAEIEAAALQYANSSEQSVKLLIDHGNERGASQQLRAEEAGNLEFQERVRNRYATELVRDRHWRRVAELFDHIRRGDVGIALTAALQEIGVTGQAFVERFATPNQFEGFFAGVHTLEVTLSLTLARDQDRIRGIAQNDARDLIGLSVAIPYSNVVVSERYWCHMVRERRLDTKYRTTVITDARDLPTRLANIGCL
jgi:hypothetical protein